MRRTCLALLLTLCAAAPAGDEEAAPAKAALGKPAPSFALADTQGNERSLADGKDRIVVLEWTDPRCIFVQQVYRSRAMQRAHEQVKAIDERVLWLAVNSTRGALPQEMDFWIRQQGLPYPILLDGDGAVARLYDATRAPQMFVIDAEGVLRYRGAIDNNKFLDKHPDDLVNYVVEAVRRIAAGGTVEKDDVAPYGCTVKR